MIVDEQSDILALLEKALNIEGFTNIIKIEDGSGAVEAYRELLPDRMILDAMLPGMDGYEVCEELI